MYNFMLFVFGHTKKTWKIVTNRCAASLVLDVFFKIFPHLLHSAAQCPICFIFVNPCQWLCPFWESWRIETYSISTSSKFSFFTALCERSNALIFTFFIRIVFIFFFFFKMFLFYFVIFSVYGLAFVSVATPVQFYTDFDILRKKCQLMSFFLLLLLLLVKLFACLTVREESDSYWLCLNLFVCTVTLSRRKRHATYNSHLPL